MARYSGATWRPVAWANARDDRTPATIAILHVTASLAASQYRYFDESRKACSHFHIALDGDVEQYIDTDRLSAADYEGSDDAISIETAGLGDGEWTPAQVSSLIKLLAWIHETEGIPLVLKTTSRPTEHGIGWHRLGITGNFPALPSILAGRNQRGYAGEAWSLSGGKVCPGDKRIKQIPAIVSAAAGDPITGGFMTKLTDDEQQELKEKVDVIFGVLTRKIKDGKGATTPDEVWERTLAGVRSIRADQIADDAVPVEVDVQIDADAVADRLLERLPKETAEAVLTAMHTRLAQ